MLKLNIIGMPPYLKSGLREAAAELAIELAPEGLPVEVRQAGSLRAELSENSGLLTYSREVEIFRGLAHMAREGIGCHVEEHVRFDTNGFMLDASRNAVPKTETIRFLLRRMALMGLNLLMLYTEDTYEVEGYPYFGYLRGGYTKEELKSLDDYAASLGIEMAPCIQTLGHSAKLLRWRRSMGRLSDTGDVLLVGEEETYRYISQLLCDASAPYRSRRIHIGMDEAHGLGCGVYREKHGDRPAIEIFQEHIQRVREIALHQGLRPMIWSDMYFTLLSPTGDYDPDLELPDETLRMIPSDIDLVYWDYYHHDSNFYRRMIEQHRKCGAPLLFAGGLWNWCTPAVNYEQMLSTGLPALRACMESGVREVLATAWGDDGAESSVCALLYGLQVYAEAGYTGSYNEEETKRRFSALHRADPNAFLDLSTFDMVPKARKGEILAPNPSHYLLYEDPITLLFEKDLEGIPLAAHYRSLHEKYCAYEADALEYPLLWEFYRHLSGVLAKKCFWRENAPSAVREKDRQAAARLAVLAEELHQDLLEFADCWYRLWMEYNRPQGWDVLDLRIGGLAARMKTAAGRMRAFARGEAEIPEMEVQKLPYAAEVCPWHSVFDGSVGYYGSWAGCVTPSHLTN